MIGAARLWMPCSPGCVQATLSEMPSLGLEIRKFPQGDTPRSDRERHQARFLACYSACGNVSKAAKWAKLSRDSHHKWMQQDPSYPQRFKDADDLFTRHVEDQLHEVGVHGVRRPVLYKGKQVHIGGEPLYEIEYDSQVLLRVAAARMEKYKVKVEQTNIQDLKVEDLTPEILDALLDHVLKKVAGPAVTPEMLAEIRKQLEGIVPMEASYQVAGEVSPEVPHGTEGENGENKGS